MPRFKDYSTCVAIESTPPTHTLKTPSVGQRGVQCGQFDWQE